MSPLIIAMAIGLMVESSLQNPVWENQAISRVQQISVSQLDSELPDRPLALWIKQVVGPRSGVTWQLTDCGEQGNDTAGSERQIQACIETTALLPDDRKVVVMTLVGNFNKGLYGKPKIQFIVVENKNGLFDVPRLRELPEMLNGSPIKSQPKPELKPVVLPLVKIGKYPLILYAANLPLSLEASVIPPTISNLESVVPPNGGPRRVSEGVLIGNALNRVVPPYPLFAKQARLSGEVKVEVTIAEDGHVVDAKAVSGPEPLRATTEEAARKWIFKPTVLNGIPVRTQGVLTFVFTRP